MYYIAISLEQCTVNVDPIVTCSQGVKSPRNQAWRITQATEAITSIVLVLDLPVTNAYQNCQLWIELVLSSCELVYIGILNFQLE